MRLPSKKGRAIHNVTSRTTPRLIRSGEKASEGEGAIRKEVVILSKKYNRRRRRFEMIDSETIAPTQARRKRHRGRRRMSRFCNWISEKKDGIIEELENLVIPDDR